MARPNEVRISLDRNQLAWYRPDNGQPRDDTHPWLVINEDSILLGVEHDWFDEEYVADWTVLIDPRRRE